VSACSTTGPPIACHYLPQSYAAIAEHTPRSVWLPIMPGVDADKDRVMNLLRPFGDAPALVKDYVKSRKHEWAEACHIPSAADRVAVEGVVRRFLELQAEDLAGGRSSASSLSWSRWARIPRPDAARP
jgi:hypothetical protein